MKMNSHLERLAEICQPLKVAEFKLKPEICMLFTAKVQHVGHAFSQYGI